MPNRTCSIDDCERPAATRGWCIRHYKRWLAYGDPRGGGPLRDGSPRPASDAARFFSKIDRANDGCWHWRGAKTSNGYGHLEVNSRTVSAHRFSYELMVGPIPDGLTLDHLCRNRACVNPEHLEPTTIWENTKRGVSVSSLNAAKSHCHKGHEFTVVWRRRKGVVVRRRECQVCRAEWAKERRSSRV